MRILIIKTSSLGDIVQAFPVLSAIKNKFGNVVIDWVVERRCADIVHKNPNIDNVIEIDTKSLSLNSICSARRSIKNHYYDVIFDMQGNVKSGLVTFFAKGGDKVGFARNSVPEWPNILFTKKRYNIDAMENIISNYLSIVSQYFNLHDDYTSATVLSCDNMDLQRCLQQYCINSKTVLLCSGSNWDNKRFSEKQWLILLDGILKNTDYHYIFVQSNDAELSLAKKAADIHPDRVSVLERVSLPLLQNIMLHAKAVVAMDSLPLHLAGLAKVSVYGIFGPSSAYKYMPVGESNKFYQGVCPYKEIFVKRCKYLRTCNTGACMKSIDIKNLETSLVSWLKNIK